MSRHFDDLNSVLEFDAGDDLWQLVFSLQSPPSFRGGVDQFEHLPKGLHKVRYYGLWHWSRREHAAQARLLLELQRPTGADVPSSETSDHTADRPGEPAATAERRACPCCKQGYLSRIRRLYPKQAGGP